MESKQDGYLASVCIYKELIELIQAKQDQENKAQQEKRIQWLRSQVIGSHAEFDTPFGKRMLTYADHTATGRCLLYIEDFILRKVLPFYGNTHTSDSFVGSNTTKMVQEGMMYIKKCMGAGQDDALIFSGAGATAGIKRLQEVMGVAIPSTMREKVVKKLRDEERWVVFVGPYEHHSNLLSWRQSTVEVVEIGADDDGLIDIGALKQELMSSKYAKRPMLGSFSACSNVTGILTNTRALARLLHKHGAFACFDFATSGPYVELDMKPGEEDGYDAVFLSPHKFIGGPGSPGMLLINKALYKLKSSPPSTCGGGTVNYVNGFNEQDTLYNEDIEEREHAGTPPIIQTIKAAMAFWVKNFIGFQLISFHETIYTELALNVLLSNPNIRILGNNKVKRLPIISFLVFPSSSTVNGEKPLHCRFVAKLLNDLFGIQGRGGCACAGPYGHRLLGIDEKLSLALRSAIQKGYSGLKPGWTRISFSYYMSREEWAFVLASIEFIASYGHLFLPLYEFDWITGDWTFKKRMKKLEGFVELRAINSSSTTNGERKDRDVFMKYLFAAEDFALSLSGDICPGFVPADIDPSLILFRI
ncbi:probable cysteine desulfurase [Dioscorea cayenensis subsp. rotundata]|uniref:Probable cysteine desulfurase n=1 Tax=Dioscorea cayennensis subsp. rotundata TaxID=55577 RepID=A0AB40B9F6_DIOCR|nr:probable cysteine desulfurase [Dioscorea cayenensis subsp. rotundata]